MQVSYIPNWKPLERLHNNKLVDIDDFMFMGSYHFPNVTIHTYKHRYTRNYINLDNDCFSYQYSNNGYIPNDIVDAISYAYGGNNLQ